MFENSKLFEIGNLEDDPEGDGVMGIRLKTEEGRVVTVRGLTEEECRALAKFWGDTLVLDLRVS